MNREFMLETRKVDNTQRYTSHFS